MTSAADRALRRRLILPGAPQVFMANLGVDAELSYEAMAQQRADLITAALSGSPDSVEVLDCTFTGVAGLPIVAGEGLVPLNPGFACPARAG